MARTDIRNFLVEISFFEGEKIAPLSFDLNIDTADYVGEEGVKEFTLFHCGNKLEAIRALIGMPKGLPLPRTFKVLRVTQPSDLGW